MPHCGNPNCRCRNTEPDQRHGPCLCWACKLSGKIACKLPSAEQAERYRPWLANDKRPHDHIRELEALAIHAAQHAKERQEK